MKTHRVLTFTLLAAMSPGLLHGATPARKPARKTAPKRDLHIYLPRTKTLTVDQVTVGDLCIVRSADPALQAAALAVTLGRAPFAGETLVIDRATILGRLAANRINSRTVALTGAPSISLKRNASTFSPEQVLGAAQEYLQTQRPGRPGCGYRLVRSVKSLLAPSKGKATLSVAPLKDPPDGYVKLEVAAVVDNKKLSTSELLFKITYPHRQALATQAIAAGTVFTPHNTRLQTINLDAEPPKSWSLPYGAEATKNIKAGAVILSGMTRAHKLEIVVKRRQAVTMIVRGPGFLVQGKGEAMQDGRPGDLIKIRNTMSSRIVMALVQYDGTVVPSMEIN